MSTSIKVYIELELSVSELGGKKTLYRCTLCEMLHSIWWVSCARNLALIWNDLSILMLCWCWCYCCSHHSIHRETQHEQDVRCKISNRGSSLHNTVMTMRMECVCPCACESLDSVSLSHWIRMHRVPTMCFLPSAMSASCVFYCCRHFPFYHLELKYK